MVAQPLADFTWRHARRIAAQRGVDDANETAVAVVLAALLRRAEQGPGPDRQIARTWATQSMSNHLPVALPPIAPVTEISEPTSSAAPVPDEPHEEESEPLVGSIVPFGIFDPFAEDDGAAR